MQTQDINNNLFKQSNGQALSEMVDKNTPEHTNKVSRDYESTRE
jgi:hypothetical protein